ncbi:hypothetical protein FG05_35259 [Fusarium graminearum]
MTGQ